MYKKGRALVMQTLKIITKVCSHLMGVPVGVKNDHSVGRLQVEAETSGSCAQQENKVL